MKKEQLEVRHADEDMQKFFSNLLEIKKFVKDKHDETQDKILLEIYNKLDKVIREGEHA